MGKMETQQDSVAYALGLSLAQNTTRDGIILSPDMFKAGYNDLTNDKSYLTDEGLEAIMTKLGMELQARQGQPYAAGESPAVSMDTLSYAIGHNVGSNMKESGMTFNADFIAAGYTHGTSTDETAKLLPQEKVDALMAAYQKQQQDQLLAKNKAEGDAFLAENKTKEGVQVTASGLQYIVVNEGSGASPTAESKVSVHYEGRFLDGKVFDSSLKTGKPVEFGVGGVIPGWTEALQLMKPGSKWTLFIPGEIAYGERGNRGIPPNSTLVFDVELLEIVE